MTTWNPSLTRGPRSAATRPASAARNLEVPVEWLLKAHEFAMGRPTVRLASYLMASEHSSPETLAALQFESLRGIVALARSNCPHYRRIGLPSPDQLACLDDLHRLPLLSRDDLREHADELCVEKPMRRRLRDHSSGSTGPAVAYYWDRLRQAWDKANRIRGHAWLGFDAGDREMHLWPVDAARTRGAKLREKLRLQRDALVGDMLLDSNNPVSASAIWQRWRQFDPARITAFPSRLCEVIQSARRQGCRLFSPSLRCVFLTGEVAHGWQKSLIERELGIPTAESYGVQEAGAIAFTCERGAWHTCAESVIVEFIREGRPALPGELAEVVVTSLVNRTMPLIRYRTGDLVRAGDSTSCPCGRSLPAMPPVVGRFGDFLASPMGEWIEPGSVVTSLGEVLAAGSFQVTQSESGRIEIHVLDGPQQCGNWRQAVVQRVTNLLGDEAPISIRRVPALGRCASGKMRYVQSQLSREFPAATRPAGEPPCSMS